MAERSKAERSKAERSKAERSKAERGRSASADGLVVVDKPAGWTSHDVVAKVRRLAGTRKVGHAGTLDPMATGVLICGVGRATRLLGYLSGHDKSYDATIRLGQSTITDDAQGDTVAVTSTAGLTDESVRLAASNFVGTIAQVPSAVSAVKVDGKRAYAKVRAGETVHLEPRTVTVTELTIRDVRRPTPDVLDVNLREVDVPDVDLREVDVLDVDVTVTCSSGTYVRAIARDLGETLGVGGHLTALRRTRIGAVRLRDAKTIHALESDFAVTDLSDAVRRAFPVRVVSDEDAAAVVHGRPVELAGETGVVGVFDEAGAVLALMEPRDGVLRVAAGFIGS